jgi:hypothetical protein
MKTFKTVFSIIVITVLFFSGVAYGNITWKLKRLTWNSGSSDYPSIAIDSQDNIYVVWEEDTSETEVYEIFLKKSTDGGTTWTKKQLTWNSVDSWNPKIAIDSQDNIYVVWYGETPGDREIFLKKSMNGGSSWTQKRLTWNSGDSMNPSIAIDSQDNIYVVWTDATPGNREIFLKKSTNGGTSWAKKRLTWNSGNSWNPSIAIDSQDNIYVVWDDDTPGDYEILMKKSMNGGTTWTQKRLTWNSGDSRFPSITIDSKDNIYVVWENDKPNLFNTEIFLKKSTNGGTSWTQKRLTRTFDGSWNPKIAIDSKDNIYVVWDDWTPGNGEIFLKKSTNGGTSWTQKRLTRTSGDSFAPSIAIDSLDNIYVVWADATPGNYEIFLKYSVPKIAGTWSTLEVIDATQCIGGGTFSYGYTATVTQNGSNIAIETPDVTLEGTIQRNTVSLTGGEYYDSDFEGWFTLTSMTLTVRGDGNSFEGTASWDFDSDNGPAFDCSGTTDITGTRVD